MAAFNNNEINTVIPYEPKEIEQQECNCITGDRDYLYTRMNKSFEKALKIDIIVSFLMESGVKLLRQELALIKERDIPVRILTGSYLNITQPQALYLLKDVLGDKADIRFYNVKRR